MRMTPRAYIRPQAVVAPLPPPIGGWDTRSSLANMPIESAIQLKNWWPETDKVTVRNGSSEHSIGMSGNIESLIQYNPLTGTGELFAANGGALYDVSSAGSVGPSVSSGHTNNRWQYAQLANTSGTYLKAVNGTDTPLEYDGTTWGTGSAITGPTAANLIWINVHQRRLWFGEEDSLSAWYLPVNTIGGAATEFTLGGVATRGGYIMAMGTWSRDAGSGMDDFAVFVTSEGQMIIYQGTDPSAAATWALVGVFDVGRPIGRRCFVKSGAELIVVTQQGFLPVSGVLQAGIAETKLIAISDKIAQAVNNSYRNYGTLFGWQPILFPTQQMLVFNIPTSTTTAEQYVFNTLTGAAARFTGMNALCFGMREDSMYFGTSDGRVMKFWDGTDDDGNLIVVDGVQAFTYLDSPLKKALKKAEVICQSNADPKGGVDINTDFEVINPDAAITAEEVTGTQWDVAEWDVDNWAQSVNIYSGWRGVRGNGRSVSVRFRVRTTTSTPSWIATNLTFIPGGLI